MKIGHKQKKLIEIAKKNGVVTSTHAKKFYGNIHNAIASLNSLEILGLLKFNGNGTWKYVGDNVETRK